MNNETFCHLHLHTEYSLLDGFGKAEQYIARAKELGFKYIACTDHGNIDGLIKFQKCCENNDIIPILGCELYVVDNIKIPTDKKSKERRGHIVVLVKDKIGWNNLTKMLTIANIDGFYKKPRVDFDTVLNHCEGLVFLTACTSSFLYNEKGKQFLESLLEKTKDVYGEIMPIEFTDQKKHNKHVIDLAKKYNLQLVASNDCHYPYSKNAKAQEVLLAIQTKVKWNDPNRWKFQTTDLFLKSADEMLESFQKHHKYIEKEICEKAILNTVEIAKKCNFRLEKSKIFLPETTDSLENDIKLLKQLCKKGLYDKIISKEINSAIYRKRMKYELSIIQQQGFVRYFLVIYDIIKWCKENNILVGYSRGSAGGSLVAYLLNIIEIDPIKHDLMFERFISPDRVDLPDIDIDFEDKKRSKIREYVELKYGKFNVASVSTFLQMKSKMVFRDVCRVFDIPITEVNMISKFIEDTKLPDNSSNERTDITISELENVFNTINECIAFKKKNPKLIDYCLQLENQCRGIGKHAAAIIITKDDLRYSDRCNLTNRANVLTINWDKKDSEYMGMLKIDILGLSNLSIVNYTRELIKTNYNIDLDINTIDINDKKILREFARGNCIGVFQFGTYGLRKLCKDLKIDSFNLLAHTTALYRPSSLRSGMVDEFKFNRQKNIRKKHNNKLDDILSDTYGIIIYQEQIINIINKLALMPFTEADKIRKLFDKENKEELSKYKYKFIQGCMSNNINRLEAINIWNILNKYGGYQFNKSHAFGYTLLSFLNMWLKYYYPTEFMCASLTYSNPDKKKELLEETKHMGLKVMTPKIGLSDKEKWVSKNKVIYMPFTEIFGIGEKFAEKIVDIKDSGFFDNEIKGKLKNLLNEIYAFDKTKIYEGKLIKI